MARNCVVTFVVVHVLVIALAPRACIVHVLDVAHGRQ